METSTFMSVFIWKYEHPNHIREITVYSHMLDRLVQWEIDRSVP